MKITYKTTAKERARVKAYREAHQEQYRAYHKQHYKANKQRMDAQAKEYRHTHREALKHYHRNYHLEHKAQIRKEVFQAYGGAICVCCKEVHMEFLTLDHLNGGGKKHRKSIKKDGYQFYRWLKNQGYPPGYRVLCINCNFALGLYGYCPHGNLQDAPVSPSNGVHSDQLPFEWLR